MRRRYVCCPAASAVLLALLVLGTTGGAGADMSFLAYGVDAQSIMLGQAVTSLVDDAAACYWNPAGLAHVERSQMLLSHVESFADLRREYAAVTQPVGGIAFGFAFDGVWTDNLEGYDESANPTGSFGWSEFEASLSAGMPIGSGIAVGAAGKMLREDIGAYSANGWAVDLGAQWAPEWRVPLRFGLTVKNLGPPMKFIETEFDLPLTVQGGVSWQRDLGGNGSRLTLAADLKSVHDDGTAALFGAEYGYGNLLSFGVGYQGGQDNQDVSFGIGVERGRVAFHWAFIPISDELGNEDEHRFSLRLAL
jgi:hypothetical protein